MTKHAIAAVVGSLCALLLCEPHSFGQSLSGSSLNISGTAILNVLDVTGVPDFQNNTFYFGTYGTTCALSLVYDDANSSITLQSSRPSSVWNWQRLTASGSTANAMQLDASNRLILTGTATTNPPQLVLDPNGAISVNGSNLITQTAADSRYLSSSAGLTASNGNIGIGTTTPTAKLDVAGNLKVGTYALPASDAIFIIGNGSAVHSSNALTVTSSGRLNLFDPSNPAAPTLILDPSATGTSQFPGTVLITPQGDVGMGVYATGTQGTGTSAYAQVFPTGIQVSGSSAISGQTVVSGTLDLTSAVVVGTTSPDSGVTTAKLAANSVTTEKLAAKAVTTDKLAFDGGALSGFRNRIIDGAFTINQRGYASGTALAAGAYAHDRWKAGASGCTYVFTQNKADTTITITAGSLKQVIEDANIEGGNFVLSWAGSAQARVNGGGYSSSPLTVSGLPVGTAVTVEFSTGTVKDVQFESGTTATPFERRFYGSELLMSQRYFCIMSITVHAPGCGWAASAYTFPVTMRNTPTPFTIDGGVFGSARLQNSTANLTAVGGVAQIETTSQYGGYVYGLNIAFTAEL